MAPGSGGKREETGAHHPGSPASSRIGFVVAINRDAVPCRAMPRPLSRAVAADTARRLSGRATGEISSQGFSKSSPLRLVEVAARRPTGDQRHRSCAESGLPMGGLPGRLRAINDEQAHQQLKEELGLDHFEGRSWQGLHRHALMTMIAYAFHQPRLGKPSGARSVPAHRSAAAASSGSVSARGLRQATR
jgi:hypothetical protein